MGNGLAQLSANSSQQQDLLFGSIEALRLALALARNDSAAIADSLARLPADAPALHKLTINRGHVQRVRGFLRLGDLTAARQALAQAQAWIERAHDPQDVRLAALDALWALYWVGQGDHERARHFVCRLPEDGNGIERQLMIELRSKLKPPQPLPSCGEARRPL